MYEYILSAGLTLALVLSYAGVFDTTGVVVIVAALVGTVPVVVGALRSLARGTWASMDMLASVALVFSLVSAEWASAAFIALMLSMARLLSAMTALRAERSVESLLKLRPTTVRLERNGHIESVPLSVVVVGDVVVLDVGDRIPVDGVVLAGEAAVDESSLTGESLPVDKSPGASVFSSTLIFSGGLRVRAEKVGSETTLEKIVELVKVARADRPKIETMGERFGKAYLVGIIIFAIALLALTGNQYLVLAVVLVVCADDVAIAIPLAYLGAIGSAARRGVVVKGSAHLEALGRAKTFVFDKTGTLTRGALAVVSVHPAAGVTENEFLQVAARACRSSKHPQSRAIVAYADVHGITQEEPGLSRTVSGKGIVSELDGSQVILGRESFLTAEGITIPSEIRAVLNSPDMEGKSISFTARDGRVLGALALQDDLKQEAKGALAVLRSLGVTRTIMLTGDNESVAKTVATELGIDEYRAGLLPEEKVAAIRKLRDSGEVVMVGDGVNDAAAISTATVGIAMGAIGYDTAIESAHIVLMNDSLTSVVDAVRLSRRVAAIAKQDFVIWGVTNVVGLALVFGGVIGPTGAAAYNFISDFFPLGNSVRAWFAQRS